MIRTKYVNWKPLEQRRLVKNASKENAIAFIQARMTSTRFPGKIYKPISGVPMLYHCISRAKEAKTIKDVVVISPHRLDLPEDTKHFIYDGPENDVLSRYYAASKVFKSAYIVRITSDCPVLDPNLIDYVVYHGIGRDYCSNVLSHTFPDGMDVEVLSKEMLKYLNEASVLKHEREHVTLKLRTDQDMRARFDLVSVESVEDFSGIKISVDTEEDLGKVSEYEQCLKEKQYC